MVKEIRQRRSFLAPYFEIHAKFDHNGKTVLWETSNNYGALIVDMNSIITPTGKSIR